jgi:hypothetical protein
MVYNLLIKYVNLLGENIQTVKISMKILGDTTEHVGLEIKAGTSK